LFEKYLSLLRKWQRVQRLVGSPDPRWIIEHLLLDSLLFLQVIPNEASRVADLGSGAGFPGIPIKIVKPAIELTLIESKQRRVSFLATVIRDLALSDTGVLSSRAEDVEDPWWGVFDVVVARCAGQMARILPTASRLAREGGVVILADSPSRPPLAQCERVEVSGLRPGTTRAFAILRKASTASAGD
jgi:16S rRNA (guanine527-N7)-methyltransferase